jgi:hypothetical protein
MKRIFQFVILFPYAIYVFLTRKAFYVTGTFLDKNGVRMFCKTIFVTHGNILPIRSLEKTFGKAFGVENVLILNFNRIPFGMVKYLEEDWKVDIES